MIKENEVYNNNDHEGPTKIVNFLIPGDVDLTLGQGHLIHYGEYG